MNTEVAILDWAAMSMGLFGGLALFLFGMDQMADALKSAAGQRMKAVLAKLTTNRFTAATTGALVTAIIQSSSVTTVLVVGFISAGMMSLTQSIGIIMGANVGTTITAQIVAFKVTAVALWMVAIGFALLFFARTDRIKHYGGIVMGLGMVFFGMSIMSDAMQPLRDYPPFLELMVAMEQPLLAILVAAVFTALVQSSSATTGVVVIMASQGFVTLPAGIALALGANIGTCVTALLASIGKPREAVRASLVHVLFNVFGVLIWLAFISHLAAVSTWVSPVYPALQGVERLAAEAPRQIANANTLFNVINTVVFLGFTGTFAMLVKRLVPDAPPVEEAIIVRPKYLDDELLETPAMALSRVRMETGHLGDLLTDMLQELKPGVLRKGRNHLQAIVQMDDQIDILHADILQYLGQIRQQALSEQESGEFLGLLTAVDNLESIGDVLETNLTAIGYRVIELDLHISDEMKEAFGTLVETIKRAVTDSVSAVRDEDELAAQAVINLKAEINRQLARVVEHEAERLAIDDPKRLELFRVQMGIAENLKNVYTLARRVARTVMPAELTTSVE